MISVMRLMLTWVSVRTSALPASFAVISEPVGSSGWRFCTSCVAVMKWMGMICVTSSSFLGMASGSLPLLTGMSRRLAFSLVTIVSVRPLRSAVRPFLFSAESRTASASSCVTGWLLQTSIFPRTSASETMMKPAASLR